MGHDDGGGVRWIGVADAWGLRQIACRSILDAATRAIDRRGRFLIVLAGGHTPRDVYGMLRTGTDWSRWHVYFGDERGLPAADAGRNSVMAGAAWLDHVPIPPGQVHTIAAELGVVAAARAYADTLRGVDDFDMVLLGLGEDGHTASLFPGLEWGVDEHAADAMAVFDAPKPPPHRVSLSVRRLNRTRAALFLVAGEAKRRAIEQWRAGADIPARAIQPKAGVDVLVESALLPADGS